MSRAPVSPGKHIGVLPDDGLVRPYWRAILPWAKSAPDEHYISHRNWVHFGKTFPLGNIFRVDLATADKDLDWRDL